VILDLDEAAICHWRGDTKNFAVINPEVAGDDAVGFTGLENDSDECFHVCKQLASQGRRRGQGGEANYSLVLLPEWADKQRYKPMKTTYPISSLLHHKAASLWSIAPEATVYEAIKLMAEKNIGALLVMSGDRLAGLFTERDYTRKVVLHGKTSKETRVWEIMPKEIISVTPDDSVENCMRLMTEKRVRHVPVVADNKVVGIISIGDLVNWIISTQNAAIEQLEQYIAGGATA
jgi:predicted transcriptional regulator